MNYRIPPDPPRPLLHPQATPADTRASLLYFLPFAIVFLDSAFAYFLMPLGVRITPNALVPLLLLYFAFADPRALVPPGPTIAWLVVLATSLCLAIVTAEGMDIRRPVEVASCVASFLCGYLLWHRVADADRIAPWLIGLSALYVVICLIALSGLDPQHFPMRVHYWSQEGLAQARPSVMADSNMQFYYLFPAALTLALPFRPLRATLAASVVIGGLYVLAQLQTRSGTLTYGGVILFALAAPLWNKALGRAKMLWYPVIAIAAAIVFWPTIQHTGALLLYRLGEADMASGNGRLGSTLYAFGKIADPYWWIPRGADEFMRRHGGGLPHSNLTAMLLDGGLPGLLAWLALVVAPIVQMSILLWRRRLDAAAIMALIAAVGVLLVQLSLHNPTRDQIWLWAGALLGAMVRVRAALAAERATRHATSAAQTAAPLPLQLPTPK